MPTSLAERRAAPAYRGFAVEVVRARRLSPSFLRMTFTGPDLHEFGTAGLDQRIKLVLPAACGAPVDPAFFADEDWYAAWRERPADQREALRTYTVRAVRPAEREVDIDVVLHGVAPGAVTTRGCGLAELLGCACSAPAGPAVRWCAAARQGDPLVLIGPNALYDGEPTGIEWRPPADATRYVLAGDETAVPAISAIVEQLPADAHGQVFLEVPTQDDVLDLAAPAGVAVRWLPRSVDGVSREFGEALLTAVREAFGARATSVPAAAAPDDDAIVWEVPAEPHAAHGLYAWVAGEAGVVKELRRILVRDVGVDRSAVAFMGYWRAGRPEL